MASSEALFQVGGQRVDDGAPRPGAVRIRRSPGASGPRRRRSRFVPDSSSWRWPGGGVGQATAARTTRAARRTRWPKKSGQRPHDQAGPERQAKRSAAATDRRCRRAPAAAVALDAGQYVEPGPFGVGAQVVDEVGRLFTMMARDRRHREDVQFRADAQEFSDSSVSPRAGEPTTRASRRASQAPRASAVGVDLGRAERDLAGCSGARPRATRPRRRERRAGRPGIRPRR